MQSIYLQKRRPAIANHLLRQNYLHFDHSPFFPRELIDFPNSVVHDWLRKVVFSFFGYICILGKFGDGNQLCPLFLQFVYIYGGVGKSDNREINSLSAFFCYLQEANIYSFTGAQYVL